MSHIIATAESYAIRCGELAKENDLLRRQVGAVETERTVIANQYAELADLFRGPSGMDHDAAVSNAACTVNELYEMTEDRNGMRQERDLLQRQVEEKERQVDVLVGEINVHICDRGCDACPLDAECHPSGTPDESYCVSAISAWSLAKAKEGGGGE